MKKKKINSRRSFLKNTSLSLLSFTALSGVSKIGSAKDLSQDNQSNLDCQQSTEDAYGQGPFYTSNAPSILNNQLADPSEIGTRIIISGQDYKWISSKNNKFYHNFLNLRTKI